MSTIAKYILNSRLREDPETSQHFKGWWPDLATLKAAFTAEPGDSAYVKDAAPATTWSIYIYDIAASTDNYWADSGTDADTSNVQTFESGQAVNSVRIIDDFTTGGANNVLSAKKGKEIYETLVKFVDIDISASAYPKHTYAISSNNNVYYWVDNTNAKHIVIEASEGEIFKVTANADRNTSLAFLSSYVQPTSENISSNTPAVIGSDILLSPNTIETLTAPANTAYLYVRIVNTSGNSTIPAKLEKLVVKPILDADVIDNLESSSPNDALSAKQGKNLGDRMATVERNIIFYVDLDFTVQQGGAVNYGNGTLSGSNYHTGYIDVEGFRKIKYSRINTTSTTTNAGMAFYSSTKEYISGQRSVLGAAENGYSDSVIDVPENAKYARFSVFASVERKYFYVKNGEGVYLSVDFVNEAVEADNYFKGKKIAVIGPSTVYGTTVENGAQNVWTIKMRDMLKASSVVNLGIGGSTTARKEGTYDEVYLDYAQWQSDVAGGLVDTSLKYLVKDNINAKLPYHIYSYVDSEWVAGGDSSTAAGRTPIVDRIEDVPSDADVVMIQDGLGNNDWAYNWDSLGNEDDNIPTTYYGALNIICQYLLANFKGKLIVFVSFPFAWRYQPVNVSSAPFGMTSPDVVNGLSYHSYDYEAALLKTLDKYGIPFLDVRKDLIFAQVGDRWWCGDSDGKYVHPGTVAQNYIASATAARLKTLRVPHTMYSPNLV